VTVEPYTNLDCLCDALFLQDFEVFRELWIVLYQPMR
jgi:hypothetical protein